MNILISGIHGFVGTNLTKALFPGNTIYGLDIVFPFIEGIAKTYSWSDLGKYSLPDDDVIIHLADKVHDTKNQSEAKAPSICLGGDDVSDMIFGAV